MKPILSALVAATIAFASFTSFAGPPIYICWDGTVTKKAHKCPTPIPVPVVCENGVVVNDPRECLPVVICPDGTIVQQWTQCEPIPPPVKETDPFEKE